MWSVSAKEFRLDRDGQACALVDVNAVFNVQVEQNNTRVSTDYRQTKIHCGKIMSDKDEKSRLAVC